MDSAMKIQAFFENARLLFEELGIVPLMYGSLGLEYLTGQSLHADDIDILIPGCFVTERWAEFRTLLEGKGYVLVDEHEHTFEKNGIAFSYAKVEELDAFAGIPMGEIRVCEAEGVRYKQLTLEQYLKVYSASARDGYRMNVKEKKDTEKIRLIEKLLRE